MTLNTGDTLEIGARVRYGNGPGNSGTGFRLGVADGEGNGYTITTGTGGSTGAGFFRNSADNGFPNVGGTERVGDAPGGPAGLGPNEIAEITLTLTGTGDGVEISYTFDDGTSSTATRSVSGGTTAYSQLFFGNGSIGNDLLIDDVTVEFTPVPEPGSLGLLGLGCLAVLGRRH